MSEHYMEIPVTEFEQLCQDKSNAETALRELALMIDEELTVHLSVWLKEESDGNIIFRPLSVHTISKGMADKAREILRGS